MGIQGLLQFVKEASEPIHIKKYKGQTVALDMYCWLHKGAFACADKLAQGEQTDQYVNYCMKFVEMLDSFGVKPVLVFDGCTLPSKKEVEKARRLRRQANLQKGKQYLREGKTKEARECFARSVNITSAMAHEVIKATRMRGMDCIVAPYEADAQLAYLNKIGIAQAVITEDSDLLAFGCKKVVLKVDKNGNGIEIDRAQFGRCKQLGNVFTEEKFRYMCILSGCDYLASIHGIGLAKACKLLRIANNPDIITVIRKMGQYLKTTLTVTEEYIDGFIRANNTFLYQLVFDPLKRKLVPLNAYSDNVDPETLDYAGLHFGDEKALHIALGNIDISTLETRDDYNPCSFQTPAKITLGQNDKEVLKQKLPHMLSIWSKEYRPPENQLSVPKAQISPEKPCTRGKEKVINIKRLKLPSREMMAKRPREDEGLSDGALLSQYSFPSSKKQVVEKCPSPQSPLEEEQHSLVSHSIKDENPTPHHKMRNRFATILQKRNQDSGAIVIPGTRSRFFCSPKETCISSDQKTETKALSDGTERCKNLNSISCFNSEENDIFTNIKKNECELLNTSPKANTAHSDLNLVARKNISAFSWSGDLGEKPRKPNPAAGLSVLQQFCRKVESSPVSGYIDRKVQSNQSATENKPSLLELCEQSIDDDSDMMASPQSPLGVSSSLDSSYSGFDSLSSSQMSRNSDLDETSNKATSCDQVCSPVTLPELPEKVTVTVKHRVPGLQKLSPGSLRMASKLKLPGPAKASGLNKRSLSLQKRTFASNNENTPELQATIQDLWQKFGFKGEPRKLQSSQKSHPMSPVKDNLQILTPETDQSILLKSECSVQRAIQW
ncbi:exonuclease 1 isoform X1 [Stegostoma tigrinum]|uniref:exonuclease 1 isoform X1 n=1 Tax=Stegostoma tigrinum TaxID=3053191 RepID=UPI00287000AA|nr:exonuclease 1 isoform X1 [Stegostoma tigrinum]XP_059504662.1 exonuclease 1 isoform X1 [Stegostoma tigrinum]XP_059504663.1 exonuclease 1 isoform X1 [Stegostoma tigrinum]